MTESDVKVIAGALLEVYEERTGAPRHTHNLKNFDEIFKWINRAKGAFWAVTILLGLPTLCASMIEIVKFARGK